VVEASRKGGAFDTRWPPAHKDNARAVSTAPPLRAAEAAEALDWEAFSNRYFPGRRRHDMEVLTAYATYTQGHEWRTTPARLSVVAPERVPAAVELAREEAGLRRLVAVLAPIRRNRGGPMANERSELERPRAELTRRSPSTRQPVSVLPLSRRAVASFDHAGLFVVPLDGTPAMTAAAKTHEPPAMTPGRGRVAPTDRHKSGLRRYCSGCAQETEHVARAADGRGSIPAIRWPTTEPAIGTTICLNCGQWRAAASRPNPPTWSSRPRSRIAPPSLAVAAYSTDAREDWVSETAAENEGMPPRARAATSA
jgi:hypothetical protein